jgi:hypothetical protein
MFAIKSSWELHSHTSYISKTKLFSDTGFYTYFPRKKVPCCRLMDSSDEEGFIKNVISEFKYFILKLFV